MQSNFIFKFDDIVKLNSIQFINRRFYNKLPINLQIRLLKIKMIVIHLLNFQKYISKFCIFVFIFTIFMLYNYYIRILLLVIYIFLLIILIGERLDKLCFSFTEALCQI